MSGVAVEFVALEVTSCWWAFPWHLDPYSSVSSSVIGRPMDCSSNIKTVDIIWLQRESLIHEHIITSKTIVVITREELSIVHTTEKFREEQFVSQPVYVT